jgi:oxygen-dependent protoporphyrinogen oxidase
MRQVVIVGAGISGLAIAYRLTRHDPSVRVTVLEKGDRPGGTVQTLRRDGFLVEAGPNGFLDTQPATLTLCRDLGLGDRLVPASEAAGRNRYLFLGGKLRPLPNSLATFVKSDLLSWRGKLGLLLERFRPPLRDGADESVADFARRRAGPGVGTLADAVVTGIHAGDPALLSLAAAFPRLAALEREHGGLFKGMAATAKKRRAEAKARGEAYRRPGKMWSFREGLGLLIDTLSQKLPAPPVAGVDVTALRKNPDGTWAVRAEGRDAWTADAVVLACPAYRQAALLDAVDRPLAEEVAGIAFSAVAVVGLGYRRQDVPASLDGFGYIAPQCTRRDVLGVQWCSSIFPGRAPDGAVLLRAMAGGWNRPEVVGWDDGRLLNAVRAELRLALGVEAAPVFHEIVRWPRAIPQYHLGHLDRLRRIETRLAAHPGLFLAGNAYHGVALNDCTEQATRLAEQIQHFLTRSGR